MSETILKLLAGYLTVCFVLGVAFTKHLIHLYAYTNSNELTQRIEVDAHVGGVNDLSFALPNKQLCIVTCGDDNSIRCGMQMDEDYSLLRGMRHLYIQSVLITKRTFRLKVK
ncbi:topless-related protein 3-like isoform X2 [Vicia villosa]|uniref:topless-related protein 3-like isoform X2 n=1 Tax=Vicia villosa TaxID=3911 RepID=UPI00273AA3D0|nr:topless-related protein 3-like isoform X2 [Vicia villosa]